ncbi:MAG TPA: VWA domain-containing protein [Candidatus Aenigmarchaeota archaeon]|nr:VWA domain-containing protein [Candidatus Aenigmarchaeota archaeon]
MFIEVPYRSIYLLLILVTLTIFAYLIMVRMRKKRIIKLGNFETLKRVEGYKRFSLSPILLLIKIITITLIFLVATNSIQINVMKPVANTDFVLAIDASSSMLTPDYTPNRLEVAKGLAIKWLSRLPEATKIGVVKFAGHAYQVIEPTTNFDKIKESIKNINAINDAGTAIGDALILGTSMLKSSKKEKMIILITDGKNNEGTNITRALDEVTDKGVIVYSVGIGNNEKTKEFFEELQKSLNESKIIKSLGLDIKNYTMPEMDFETLQMIANMTNGRAFHVTNETLLESALQQIIVKNERIPLDSEYYILLFIAILIILELVLFSKFGAI